MGSKYKSWRAQQNAHRDAYSAGRSQTCQRRAISSEEETNERRGEDVEHAIHDNAPRYGLVVQQVRV